MYKTINIRQISKWK